MSKFVIAGGLGILGRATAAALSEIGHQIALVDFAPAPEGGGDADLVIGNCDLADEKAVAEAYRQVHERWGVIDGLVNVAGGFLWEPVSDGSLGSWDRMYRMNLRTAVASSSAAMPYLRAGSAIVNVGAAAATAPGIGMAPMPLRKPE